MMNWCTRRRPSFQSAALFRKGRRSRLTSPPTMGRYGLSCVYFVRLAKISLSMRPLLIKTHVFVPILSVASSPCRACSITWCCGQSAVSEQFMGSTREMVLTHDFARPLFRAWSQLRKLPKNSSPWGPGGITYCLPNKNPFL